MFANATLTVDANASITAGGGVSIFSSNPAFTTTVNLNGTLSTGVAGGSDNQPTNLGGFGPANFTMGAGAVFNSAAINIGMTHYMGSSGNTGYETQFVMGPGSVMTADHSGDAVDIVYFNGFTATTKFQINGGTIDLPGADYNSGIPALASGYSFWHMGGTFEVTADSLIANGQVDSNVAVFGQGGFAGVGAPIIKFTGVAPVLTIDGDVWFEAIGQTPGLAPELDVSELVITPGIWTTIIDAGGTITSGGNLLFVAGTDTNWALQISGNDVQVMYVPEPATLAMLVIGGLGLLRRRSVQVIRARRAGTRNK